MKFIKSSLVFFLSYSVIGLPVGLRGQDVAPAETAATKDCAVCMTAKPAEEFVQLSCGHNELCRQCLRAAVENAIAQRELVQLRCAHEGCGRALTDAEIRDLVGNDTINRIQDLRFEQALGQMPGARHCPTPDCRHVFINEDNQRDAYECPSCHQHYCANCLVNHPQHVACAVAEHPNLVAWRQLPGAEQLQDKPCPNCDVRLEKTHGCNHMTCQQCHHEFCWLCLEPFDGHAHFEMHAGIYGTLAEHMRASARFGNLAQVQLFMHQGVAVDDQDAAGNTALMLAAEQGHGAIVEYLVAQGANVNRQNNAGQTALARTHSEEVRRVLLAHGAGNPPTRGTAAAPVYAQPPQAHHHGHPHHHHVHAPLPLDWLLRHAVIAGDIAAVHGLLDQGAPIHWHDGEHEGNTALILAVVNGSAAIVQALINHGALLDAHNSLGETALIKAIGWRRIDIINILLHAGADVNAITISGTTALSLAANHGLEAVVQALTGYGADVNYQMNERWRGVGNTALINAATVGSLPIVQWLVDHGANVNLSNHDGNTALMRAALRGHGNIVQYLIAHGADANVRNNATLHNPGQTALDVAANEEIRQMLRDAMAQPGARVVVDPVAQPVPAARVVAQPVAPAVQPAPQPVLAQPVPAVAHQVAAPVVQQMPAYGAQNQPVAQPDARAAQIAQDEAFAREMSAQDVAVDAEDALLAQIMADEELAYQFDAQEVAAQERAHAQPLINQPVVQNPVAQNNVRPVARAARRAPVRRTVTRRPVTRRATRVQRAPARRAVARRTAVRRVAARRMARRVR